MKWNYKREIFPIIIILIYCILLIYYYPILPDLVPTHFNIDGVPDKFSLKSNFYLMISGTIILIYLILTFIPFIDPFWKKIQKRYNIFLLLRDFVLIFLLFFFILNLIAIREGKLDISALGIGMGLLFTFFGNYLPKLPRNFFFGVRVPWTIASDFVWKKTHRLSGWLFVLVGIIIIILSILKVELLTTFLITLVPLFLFSGLVYPFYLYKKIQKNEKGKIPEL
jgi:uncharacterized membrane protein